MWLVYLCELVPSETNSIKYISMNFDSTFIKYFKMFELLFFNMKAV